MFKEKTKGVASTSISTYNIYIIYIANIALRYKDISRDVLPIKNYTTIFKEVV